MPALRTILLANLEVLWVLWLPAFVERMSPLRRMGTSSQVLHPLWCLAWAGRG